MTLDHLPNWLAANLRAMGIVRVVYSLTEDDPRHGTHGGYANWGCRCEACTRAHAEEARKRPPTDLDDDDPRHGLANTYRYHKCRCDRCRAAITRETKARELRQLERERETGE